MDDWLNSAVYTHNGILFHLKEGGDADTWIKLEDIMLRKIYQ